eukprot:TRINITY_DN6567_c0_g1_i1.p1 TRINITY_DN6567_c0_g1~~TRINITY_DN6567_c0_g1_i1.p1  ORF type:complete len:311 (+),score=74.11 TRINITY_DN6567_c0_g1_i1:69-1001(+)
MALDAQSIAQHLAALDDETAFNVIKTVLDARPELAPTIVSFSVPDLTYPPAKALMERRAMGVVSGFDAQKGFGFIACKELFEVFGCEVLVYAQQLRGIAPGTPVNFAVVLSRENYPQAFDVMADGQQGGGNGGGTCGEGPGGCGAAADWWGGADSGWGGADSGWGGGDGGWGGVDNGWGCSDSNWGFGGKSKGSSWGSGFLPGSGKKGKGGWSKDGGGGKGKSKDGFGSGQARDIQQELGQYEGVIKSFSEANGYGFIESPAITAQGYGNDVFLHRNEVKEIPVGSKVVFHAYVTSKGQVRGRELSVVPP